MISRRLRLPAALAAVLLVVPAIAAEAPRRVDVKRAAAKPVAAETRLATAAAIAPRSLPPLVVAPDRETLARAFAAAAAGRWDEAHRLAQQPRDKLGAKILLWIDLQRPRGSARFEDIVVFLERNPDWPNPEILARRAEEALGQRGDDGAVLAWFAGRAPVTVDGAMRLADAYERSGERAKLAALARETWLTGTFGGAQEPDFLRKFGTWLAPGDHWSRIDRLLWEGRTADAERMLPLLDPPQRALAEARIKLAGQARDAEAAVGRVPDALARDPGLAFERARWLRKRGDDSAVALVRAAARDPGRPDLWWREREFWARRALREGRARDAYELARDHGMAPGTAAFTEAEFLAGFVALRRLDDASAARGHFARLADAARFPVTQARAAYWIGRAAESAGEPDAARAAYRRAAEFPVTYYGQLARLRLPDGERPDWPTAPAPAAAERTAFANGELARGARLLADIGEFERVKHFTRRLVDVAATPAQHRLAAELATELGRPDLAVSNAKRSAQRAGVMLPDQGWPVIAVPASAPERALVLGTIRQESAFEADAVSRAGARGLMQLMPATARGVAKSLGIHGQHRDQRLISDPAYNLRLGQTYLASLLDDFSGSYPMALAAYNAGPGRVQTWVRDHGDPRGGLVDPIDWIELIGIEETRNYVQRVMENVQVYRRRLGAPDPHGALEKDFARGFR